MGFKLNPYELCMTNSIINGKQYTICWHVDDSKISYAKESIVADIIN